MATRRLNRLTLTISDELKAALADLNQATGVAAASFVGEMIEANIEMIRGITEAAIRAKREPAKAFEIIQRSLIGAQQDVTNLQMALLDEQAKLRTYNRKEQDDEAKE